jgi:hypothetical protein
VESGPPIDADGPPKLQKKLPFTSGSLWRMFTFCSFRGDGRSAPFKGQMTDDRDQMGALALADGGGCLGLEMQDGFRKNVYFCFGDFTS